jgi:hypothetical protein
MPVRSIGLKTGLVAVLLVSSWAWAASKQSPFANQSKPLKATATILAISSSSRQTFAGNQEVFLADLEIKGEHQFVRLIDQYPGFGLPIRTSLMKDRTLFKMQVTREPECDIPGAEIPLRDGASTIFNGSVRDSLLSHRGDTVPCYKTLHQTISIAKR